MKGLRVSSFLLAVFLFASVEGLTKYYMDENCGRTIYMYSGAVLVELTQSASYGSNMACVLHLESEELYMDRVMVKVLWIDVEDNALCKYDRLSIYDGRSTDDETLTGYFGLCGDVPPLTIYKTSREWVTFNFTSDVSGEGRGFKLLITGFDDSGFCLSTTEYECDNSYCIDNDLECDGYDNCGDDSDEQQCNLSVGGIVGITVGCIAAALIIAGVVIGLASRNSNRYSRMCRNVRPAVTERSHLPQQQPYTIYGSPVAAQYPGQLSTLPPSYDTIYSTPVPAQGQAAGQQTIPEQKH